MQTKPSPARSSFLCRFFGYSFLLHLAWENAQAPLYEGFTENLPQHLWACLYATATGDMAFTLILYGVLALVHQDVWWAANRSNYRHPATWTLPPLIGVLLVVAFELWAIYVVHRWVYGLMPIVPIVRVGVTPVLQMLVVPTVTLLLCMRKSIDLTNLPETTMKA
jgi:hypothetical protein